MTASTLEVPTYVGQSDFEVAQHYRLEGRLEYFDLATSRI